MQIKKAYEEVPVCDTAFVDGAATQVKTGAGVVHWITATNSNAASQQFELNDATSAHGGDIMIFDVPLGGNIHCVFNPAIPFATGIRIGVCHANINVLVGYA